MSFLQAPILHSIPLPIVENSPLEASHGTQSLRRVGSFGGTAEEFYHYHRTQPHIEPSIINHLIAFSRAPGWVPRIVWDVLQDPRHAIFVGAQVTYADLERFCAVRNGARSSGQNLTSLILIFPFLSMLQIRVVRSGAWVSVLDVLNALHRGLREPANERQLAAFSSIDRAKVDFYAKGRSDHAQENRRTGDVVRKVDFIGRRRGFMGIRVANPNEVLDGSSLEAAFVVELEFL